MFWHIWVHGLECHNSTNQPATDKMSAVVHTSLWGRFLQFERWFWCCYAQLYQALSVCHPNMAILGSAGNSGISVRWCQPGTFRTQAIISPTIADFDRVWHWLCEGCIFKIYFPTSIRISIKNNNKTYMESSVLRHWQKIVRGINIIWWQISSWANEVPKQTRRIRHTVIVYSICVYNTDIWALCDHYVNTTCGQGNEKVIPRMLWMISHMFAFI